MNTASSPKRRALISPARLSTVQSMAASSVGQLALVASGIAGARILGVHDRGQLALFALVPLLLTVLGSLGVPVATTYFIAREPANARGVVEDVFRLAVGQSLALTVVAGAILFELYHTAAHTVQIAAATTLVLIPCKMGLDYGGAILQGQRRFRAFNITRSLPSITYAVTICALWASGEGHLLAVTLCYVVSLALVGAGTLMLALRGLPHASNSPREPGTTGIVKFGIKAMFGAVYPTEAFQLDQAFVGALLSRVELGTYVVGVSFSNLPRFLSQAVGLVAYPEVASIQDPIAARRAIWRYFGFGAVVALISCGTLEILTPWLIPFLFGSEFRGSVAITQVLLVGAFITSIRRVLADGLRGSGFPSVGTAGELTGLLLLVPALLLLIPLDGVEGAALSIPIAAAGGFGVLLFGATRTRPSRRGEESRDGPGRSS